MLALAHCTCASANPDQALLLRGWVPPAVPSQVKAGISAAHLGDDEAAERHFAVLRDLGVDANGDLYLSVADSLVTLGRPKDATPYLQVGTPFLFMPNTRVLRPTTCSWVRDAGYGNWKRVSMRQHCSASLHISS